ncbi:MAG TPA: imelysin family protein [Parvibaculum sp.]
MTDANENEIRSQLVRWGGQLLPFRERSETMKKGLKTGLFTTAAILSAMIAAQMPAQASGPGVIPSNFAAAGAAAPTYGAAAEIISYTDLVHRSYDAAYKKSVTMQKAINAFLANPNDKTLAAARKSWLDAHIVYSYTEAYRFYQGPIDFAKNKEGDEGPEGRLNAWPLNEAFIDYTKGDPKSGIINDTSIKISQKSIRDRDQVSDEADVTTGFHAVEFLLWGQDLSATGPGARPASDYKKGDAIKDRRRLYLTTVTDGIVEDLLWLSAQWDMNNGKVYVKDFVALDQRDALGRILTGMATLAGSELSTERMSVALDSGDQEDETSCFSDNTHNVYKADQQSIANVYFGEYGDWKGSGIQALIARVDPALEKQVTAQFNKTTASIAAIPHPIDRLLATPKGSAERKKMEAAVADLQEEAKLIIEVGKKLGLNITVAKE